MVNRLTPRMTVIKPTSALYLLIVITAVSRTTCSSSASSSPQILEKFHDRLISHYTQLLVDIQNNQLIVGARGFLIKLPLKDFAKSPKIVHWPVTEDASSDCKRKGQPDSLCQNYIRVILKGRESDGRKEQVFVCGTNAFSPKCTWRNLNAIDYIIGEWIDGKTKSPSSLNWDTSSLMTKDGDIYYSGPLEFQGRDPEIFRNSESQSVMRTVRNDYKWLNTDADFILSFETENFVHSIFRESAVEYMNCGKSIFSRISRVCKHDAGGYKEQTWTTFLKARLNCSMPGRLPFYFNEIQDAFYDEHDGTLYGIFNTPENSIRGSTICAFSQQAINQTFEGPFKYQKSPDSNWEQKYQSEDLREQFNCKSTKHDYETNLTRSDEQQKYQLMHEAVLAENGKPFVVESLENFKFIAVDKAERKLGEAVRVLFVLTSRNKLRRYAIWPFSDSACLLDESQITAADDTVYKMEIVKTANSLYVGSASSIFRVSLSSCEKYTTEEQCLRSNDPYCAWNTFTRRCDHYSLKYSKDIWRQGRDFSCSDGKGYHWSPWSSWAKCKQNRKSDSETCLCRWRQCSGLGCVNTHEQEVSNCTTHGGWSAWTPWSTCSPSCGKASKTRTRMCSNPAPAFGGRQCAGNPRETHRCPELPCLTTESPARMIHSHSLWSGWSEWSDCSTSCGGGMQSKRRQCLSANNCSGCDVEWRTCNNDPCEEVILKTDWTNWYRKNDTIDEAGFQEERQKFICRALDIKGSHDLQITTKKENRFIELKDKWSECSAPCNGYRFYWTGSEFIKKSCSKLCMPCGAKKEETFKKFDYDMNSLDSDDHSAFQRKNRLQLSDSNGTILLSKLGSSADKHQGFAIIVMYCFLCTALGAGLGSLFTFLILRRTKVPENSKHQRLKSRLYADNKNTNTYVSTEEFKLNNYNPVTTSLLRSPSAISSTYSMPKEATIKRTSTIRAKLTSDQNF
ncbi:Semaphorin-5A [Halotydeus destructor]|nr:Semaphorin-5A [Halotydeus destructor]